MTSLYLSPHPVANQASDPIDFYLQSPEACVVPGLSPQRGWEWGAPLWRASRVHLSPPEPKARSSQVSCEKGRKGERKEEKGRGMGRRNRKRNEDETRKRRREK